MLESPDDNVVVTSLPQVSSIVPLDPSAQVTFSLLALSTLIVATVYPDASAGPLCSCHQMTLVS